jgi:deazaflavin-dependent oxidoreductase (nitroreductase family)
MSLPEQRPDGLDAPIVPKIMRWMTRANVWLYRATGGRVGSRWRVGAAFRKPVPICLLTTIGKRSGQPRTVAVLYMEEPDGRIVLVGSQGGLPRHPLWFSNLQANPEVTIQVKRRVGRYQARVADPAERAALWPRLVELYADFAKYQAWTEREIPVVICASLRRPGP